MKNAEEIFGARVTYASTAIECFTDADGCILVTEWDEFKTVKPEDFIERMREPIVIDGRRIYDPKEYGRKLKFAAVGMGH